MIDKMTGPQWLGKFLGGIILVAGVAIGISACAEDAVSIQMNVSYSTEAQQVIEEAQNAGAPLTIRLTYTARNLINSSTRDQRVIVQPSTAIPTGSATNGFFWETAADRGFDFSTTPLTLVGVPLGYRGVTASIEILRQGRSNSIWYPIAFFCTALSQDNQELTADLLKSFNNTNAVMQKGRACENCSSRPYVTYDSSATDSDCVAGGGN